MNRSLIIYTAALEIRYVLQLLINKTNLDYCTPFNANIRNRRGGYAILITFSSIMVIQQSQQQNA